MTKPTIQAHNIHKTFPFPTPTSILRGIDLCVYPGQSVAITGKSGSGKSCLLHILGTLDTPTEGALLFPSFPSVSKEKIRTQHIGFVFQAFHLLEDYSLLENVALPGKILRKQTSAHALFQKAESLLEQVGLIEKKNTPLKLLSGGEKQRAALARALFNRPSLLLLDEPTGSLDAHNASLVEQLLFSLSQQEGTALVLVTHNPELANRCDLQYCLQEGQLFPCIHS